MSKLPRQQGILPMLGSSFIFQRTIGSKYLKTSESKNQPFPSISQNPQRIIGFHERTNGILSTFFEFLKFCQFGAYVSSTNYSFIRSILRANVSQFDFHPTICIYNRSKNQQRTRTRLKNHPTPSLHVFYQDACKVTSQLTSQLYKSSIDQMQ